jgi:hypothetical protein
MLSASGGSGSAKPLFFLLTGISPAVACTGFLD